MDAHQLDERTELVSVGFNQQQRQLFDRLRTEGAFAQHSDGQLVQLGFTEWLRNEGKLLPKWERRGG